MMQLKIDKSMNNTDLKNLLSKYNLNPLVRRCIEKIEGESVEVSIYPDLIETQKLKNIYTIRIKIDRAREVRLIEGGDDLLNAFDMETDDFIKMSTIDDGNYDYIIFSNSRLNRLVGILAVKKKNSSHT